MLVEPVLIAILVASMVSFAALNYFGRRNVCVYEHRKEIIRRINAANTRDILAGKSCEECDWRYAVFQAVSYEQMLFSFRSLDSFYPDKSFLQ